MNDYTAIAKHIRDNQLQRSVMLAEVLTDGFVWVFRAVDLVADRIAAAFQRKPGNTHAAQH
jgi:hypothetical protein